MCRKRLKARPIVMTSPARWSELGLVISELSTHLEGQLVAVNPVYSDAFDHFAL